MDTSAPEPHGKIDPHRTEVSQVSGPDSVEPVIESIGPRLRETRTARGLTLSEVAERLGVSVSTLSRLESGRRRATLDLLIGLARIYRVALDDLVGAPATGDPRIRPTPVRVNGIVFLPLTSPNAPVEAVKIVLPGHRPGDPITQRAHGGYEWLYVLSGTVDLKLGPTITRLGTGEAAEFDTREPHGMVSATTSAAKVLALFSAEGERIHVGLH